jgi:hypothetical protein
MNGLFVYVPMTLVIIQLINETVFLNFSHAVFGATPTPPSDKQPVNDVVKCAALMIEWSSIEIKLLSPIFSKYVSVIALPSNVLKLDLL